MHQATTLTRVCGGKVTGLVQPEEVLGAPLLHFRILHVAIPGVKEVCSVGHRGASDLGLGRCLLDRLRVVEGIRGLVKVIKREGLRGAEPHGQHEKASCNQKCSPGPAAKKSVSNMELRDSCTRRRAESPSRAIWHVLYV